MIRELIIPERIWNGAEPPRTDPGWPHWWEQTFVDDVFAELAFAPVGRGPDGKPMQLFESNLERIEEEQGVLITELELLGENPETQFIMWFRQMDAGREGGVFVNLWHVFGNDPTAEPEPRIAGTLFLTHCEEPGGLVAPGYGMGWVDTERERVEWFWDPGSLLFRGPPYSTLMKGHQQQ